MMKDLLDPYYLQTISMSDLYQLQFDGKLPVVENLLCNGVYILAGAPKIGKSFLVAQIAYHVSKGQALWGLNVNQGTVLYLALEDDYRRLQRRMFMMYGTDDTTNLYFATGANKVGNGLEDQFEFFIAQHPNTKLIIVDTLQKTREVGGEGYSYGRDYDIMSKFKQFADKHAICILVVHHTRKQQADDAFEMISGTTGLLGCVDGSLLMKKEKRTAIDATIEVVGRDQPDQILYIKKDPITQIWDLQRSEVDLFIEPPDPVLVAIAKLINSDRPEWNGSPTDLVRALDIDIAPNTLSKHLNVKSNTLKEKYNIKYENKAMHAGRRVKLIRMKE